MNKYYPLVLALILLLYRSTITYLTPMSLIHTLICHSYILSYVLLTKLALATVLSE